MSRQQQTRRTGRFLSHIKASVSLAPALAMAVGTQPVYAASLPVSNVVNACSGVSLPPSVVTGIMSPVVTGVASATETRVNSILGVLSSLPLGAVTLPSLNTNASGLLSTAAAGQPITLKVISNNGTLLGPSDACYSQASGYTLSGTQGITIGGNQITGLGADGVTASAGEINSIAFGNNASTAASATGAIAIGTNSAVNTNAVGSVALGNNAIVSAANSIALGAGSTASRGALTNYTGYALSTPQTSVGEVSVGAGGSNRQITNVAAGSSANDAVNVAQLTAVAGQVSALGNLAIQYDSSGKSVATLGGSGGTTLTNVKAGAVTSSSTDAVNGSQLFATNANVTTNTNNIATNTANITANTNAIASNSSALNTLTNNVTNGAIGPVQFSNSGTPTTPNGGTKTNDVTYVGGSAGAVRVHNVANGTVASGSTDAVNGDQLATTNANVTTNTANIAANTTSITNLTSSVTNATIGPVRFSNSGTPTVPNSGTPTNDLALSGAAAGTVGLHNVGAATLSSSSTDAVNGSQLFATNSNVTANTTAITNLTSSITNATLGPVRFSNAGSPLVPNSGTPTNDLVLSGATAGNVRLHNVGNGAVTSTSSDAVNGSQLFTTNTNVTANATSINNISNSVTNLGSSITNGAVGTVQFSNAGTPTTPNGGTISNDMTLVGAGGAVSLHNVANGTVASGSTDAINGDQLFTTNANVTANTNAINTINNNYANLTTNISNGALGPVRYSNSGTPTTPNGGIPSNDLTLIGVNGANVRLHNVANGTVSANSTDAVNGSQLFATNSNVTANTTAINNISTSITNGSIGTVQFSSAGSPTTPNGGIPSNDMTLVGGSSGSVTLHNVSNGALNSTSTDAVNGSQLFAVSSQIGLLSGLAVQYDDSSKTKITLGGANAPSVTITNVTDGELSTASSDAVNGKQLNATNLNVAQNTTDISNLTTDYNSQANQITSINHSITINAAAVSDLHDAVQNGALGPVQYSNSSNPTMPNGGTISQDLTLVGASSSSPVFLHNVGAGVIGSSSTDAINGGQIYTMANGLTSIFGSVIYNANNNSFTPNFSFGGNNYASVQSVFGAIETQLGNMSTQSTSGTGTAAKYFHSSSILADSDASGMNSTAIGPNAQASGQSAIAAGENSQATSLGAVAIGSTAIAKDGKAVSIGYANVASGNGAVSIGDPNVATGDGAVALGKDNTSTGDGAVALGDTNTANGDGAIALGYQNQSNGMGATAIGNQNNVTGDGAIALGNMNTVSGAGSLAIGSNVSITAADSLAIGTSTSASQTSATAIGNRASAAGIKSTAVGNDSIASDEESAAFGVGAQALQAFSTAVGSEAIASGSYAVAVGTGSIASGDAGTALGQQAIASGVGGTALGVGALATKDESVALGSAARTDRGAVAGYSAFGLNGSQSSIGEIAVALTEQYYNPYTGQAIPTGNRQITGVAPGSADTDAVNVSQLRGVSDTLGTAFASSLGGGSTYNSTTGALTGPSYTLNGNTYTNVGDALSALASYYGSGSGSGGSNSVNYSNPGQTQVNLGGSGGTVVSNVGNGAVNSSSTDAVNGSQLQAAKDEIEAKVSSGAIGAVQYSNNSTPNAPNGGTVTNDVALVGASSSAPVGLHNVADGSVSSSSTDAVNGRQLAAVQATATQALAANVNAVEYDSSSHSSISLGSAGAPVAIHNVAAGVAETDAANVGQLNAGVNSAVAQANKYTDDKLASLSFDLKSVRKGADAGTAAALAAAGMPQAYEAGKGMIAMAGGTYRGETAFAIGFSKAFDDGHTVIKLGATYNSAGTVGATAGVGFQF